MTRTKNTLRVTFSANLDAGEGYLTDKSQDHLDLVLDQGWLWARDVVGDWQKDLARVEERATAEFAGWFDLGPKGAVAPDVEAVCQRLWRVGVWPDFVTAADYEAAVGEDVLDPDRLADDYACGPEFFRWMMDEARAEARKAVADMRAEGVAYPHGRHPSYDQLVQFYTLLELIGGEDEAEKVLAEKQRDARIEEQSFALRRWAIDEVLYEGATGHPVVENEDEIKALSGDVIAGKVSCPLDLPDLIGSEVSPL